MVSKRAAGEVKIEVPPDLAIKTSRHFVRMGVTNLSETGGGRKRQGERYVDAIRDGEDVQVLSQNTKNRWKSLPALQRV